MKYLMLMFVTGVCMSFMACRTGGDCRSIHEQKADSVLKLMTLEEKIGQLNQYTGNWQATGPVVDNPDKIEKIKAGLVGSMLNIKGAGRTRELQEAAMQSRLKIPLIFGLDVVHGLRTIFPIPLGEAASFDLEAIGLSARSAAEETAASGLHWTFAPMVDISRDARWGRVMEGAGEDPYYGSLVAAARVKGFQGDDLKAGNTILACAKHFAGYGAPVAGKDYNTVEIAPNTFYNVYLPPYKAAADAGVATFMNAFNDLDGIPCTGNSFLLRDLLKGEWDFPGFVVSDWGSIREMVPHGYATDRKDAALKAITAGCDMDMESVCYLDYLKTLVETGELKEELIDDAVKRILTKKFELGLFDDPFGYCDQVREDSVVMSPRIRRNARDVARKSIVLLKNEDAVLPLNEKIKSIALIGPLNDSKIDMSGFWANERWVDSMVTVRQAFHERGVEVNYAEGYDLETGKLKNPGKAIEYARRSDAVIVAVGERWDESGEAKSRGNIEVPDIQQELVESLCRTGKPVITLIMAGRPLIFNRIREHSPAILYTWWLGTEAGHAITDVLYGDYNPSGKLPMTFPQHLAQIPIYYNYKATGRPENPDVAYSTCYLDISFKPAYPFGYGLSYTTFEYSNLRLSADSMGVEGQLKALVTLENTGKYSGYEIVQLYIKDCVASVTRPVKELKGIRKVWLASGEKTDVEFTLSSAELGFYNAEKQFVVEPGDFEVMVGGSSDTKLRIKLKVK